MKDRKVRRGRSALFSMLLARVPNLMVEMVSTALYDEGEQAIIRHVLELPLHVHRVNALNTCRSVKYMHL